MWHLVCGDMAVEGVIRVIGDTAARGLRALRDDLAVGPLADVERLGRAQCLRQVLGLGAEARKVDHASSIHHRARRQLRLVDRKALSTLRDYGANR